mmetsp:Transcript_56017/g.170521  ORF Transcript_56017/g.170521 Transcript_56017/m.170521 type:complete len:306 (+) Transcript_56017:770-1687(+)
MRIGILQLDGLDLPNVQQVPCVLGVRPALRELRLLDELHGLLVQVVRQVVPEQQVEERGLAHGVVAQARRAVGGEELGAEVCQPAQALVRERPVKVCFGRKDVQRPAVERLQPLDQRARALQGFVLLLFVGEDDDQQQHRECFHLRRVRLRQRRELHLRRLGLLLVGHRGVRHRGVREVRGLAGAGDRLLEEGAEHVGRDRLPEAVQGARHPAHDPRVASPHRGVDRLEILPEALDEQRPRVLGRLLLLLRLVRVLLLVLVLALALFRVLHLHILVLAPLLGHRAARLPGREGREPLVRGARRAP